VKAVAAFLRAINALDNIRELNKLLGAVEANVLLAGEHPADVVKRAVHDIDDAIMVLQDGGLHPTRCNNSKKPAVSPRKPLQVPQAASSSPSKPWTPSIRRSSLILG
jgi:hypothetical protein